MSITNFVPLDFPSQNASTMSEYSIIEIFRFSGAALPYRLYSGRNSVSFMPCDRANSLAEVSTPLAPPDTISLVFFLLASNERTARTAERVEDNAVAYTRIFDMVGNERNWLHCGVAIVLFRFVELPNCGPLAVGVPLVLAVFPPTEKARLMLPLIQRMSENKRLLHYKLKSYWLFPKS